MADDTGHGPLAAARQGSEAFYSRFVRVGAVSLALVCLIMFVMAIAQKQVVMLAACAMGMALYSVSYWLTYRGTGILGRRLFVYGFMTLATVASILDPSATGKGFGTYTLIVVVAVTLAGFLLTRVDLLVNLVVGLATLVFLVAQDLARGHEREAWNNYLGPVGLLLVEAVAVTLFTQQSRDNQEKLHDHVEEVDRVMEHAQRIARGDLTGTVEGDSEVSRTIAAMLEGLRGIVVRMRDAAVALSSSAKEIAAMARQQEQGAVEQATAVTQVHKTLAMLLDGSGHAAQSTDEVFRNVELTQRTSEVVQQRAAALSTHTRRISAILEIIKNISNKSEILALNAALEGARAGEAGRGFSLVASQMQRLAETVMESVRDVRALIEDIETATTATLAATEESTQLSARATMAARQISVTLQQQRASTEQVTSAMQDIQQVTTQVSAGSTQAMSATNDLTRLADELKRTLERFRL